MPGHDSQLVLPLPATAKLGIGLLARFNMTAASELSPGPQSLRWTRLPPGPSSQYAHVFTDTNHGCGRSNRTPSARKEQAHHAC